MPLPVTLGVMVARMTRLHYGPAIRPERWNSCPLTGQSVCQSMPATKLPWIFIIRAHRHA